MAPVNKPCINQLKYSAREPNVHVITKLNSQKYYLRWASYWQTMSYVHDYNHKLSEPARLYTSSLPDATTRQTELGIEPWSPAWEASSQPTELSCCRNFTALKFAAHSYDVTLLFYSVWPALDADALQSYATAARKLRRTLGQCHYNAWRLKISVRDRNQY